MVGVRGDVLRPPHGTTPAAVSHVLVMVSEFRRFVIQLLRKWLCILKPKLTFLVYRPNIVQKHGYNKAKVDF